MADPEQDVAFRAAVYGLPGWRFTLSQGQQGRPPWAPGGEAWAIVTAWNPAGQPQVEAQNRAASAELDRALRALGRPARPVVNGSGPWEEEARLISGLDLTGAAALGRGFGQRAVLWGRGGRVALVWPDGGGVRTERFWVRRSGTPD